MLFDLVFNVKLHVVPIDAYSVFPTYDLALQYAQHSDVAYPGQYIAVVNPTEYSTTGVKIYVIGVQNAGLENEEGILIEIPTGTFNISASTLTLYTNIHGDSDNKLYTYDEATDTYTEFEVPQNSGISGAGTYLVLTVGDSTVYVAVGDLINFDNYVTKMQFNASIGDLQTSIGNLQTIIDGGFQTGYNASLAFTNDNKYLSLTQDVSRNSLTDRLGRLEYNLAVAESTIGTSTFANTSLATDGYVKEQLAWHCIEGTNDEPEPEPEP